MKGITPIISIIILLLITIGLASAAWTYMSGYLTNLTSRTLGVTPASCIGGTQVTFLVRNAGTNNIGSNTINVLDMSNGSPVALAFKYLNGTDIPSGYVIQAGETIRALLPAPPNPGACTTAGNPKTCQYELTLKDSTWNQALSVACTG